MDISLLGTLLIGILGIIALRFISKSGLRLVFSLSLGEFFRFRRETKPAAFYNAALKETLCRALKYEGLLDDLQFHKEDVLSLLDESGAGDRFKKKEGSHYPQQPLYKEIGLALSLWAANGEIHLRNRFSEWEKVGLPHISCETIRELETRFLDMLYELDDNLVVDLELVVSYTADFLSRIGIEGVLALLGMVRTFKSVSILPPSKELLFSSSKEQHSPKSSKSVANVAMTKHLHRSSERWFGEMQGNDEHKNERALDIVKKILKEPTWINIHVLPPNLSVLEVRTYGGYGARWTADGRRFRGFLEPHMDDGHEVRWRH